MLVVDGSVVESLERWRCEWKRLDQQVAGLVTDEVRPKGWNTEVCYVKKGPPSR